MKTKIFAFIFMLLSSALGALAQQRIKKVDITIELPKVGASTMDKVSVKSVIADAFGSENMLGEGKMETWVQVVKFDDYGNQCHLAADEVYEAGRKYKFAVHVTNYTDVLFNYKNNGEYTVDNSMVKASVNGEKASISLGAARSVTFEACLTMPGTRDPLYDNTSVSEPDGELAGFGYVDLGLPSGTKWATCNLGASKPEALGDKYAYGETKTKKTFTSKNFTGYGAYTLTNPYGITSFAEEDNKYSVNSSYRRKLKPEYDCARQNMGGEWSLPSRGQCSELRAFCYVKYAKVNGVEGTLYTSLKNGKSIFLPFTQSFKNLGGASGYMTANSGRIKSMFLFWWGSSYSKNDMDGTCIFENNTYLCNEDELGGVPTYLGHNVRAVWGGNDNVGSKTILGKKSKASNKKSSDDTNDSGESKKVDKGSAVNTVKKIGKGLKSIFK